MRKSQKPRGRMARGSGAVCLEQLESRVLLSSGPALGDGGGVVMADAVVRAAPFFRLFKPLGAMPYGSSGPVGMTPAQIRRAYGIDQITFGAVTGDGSGQTIAIIDAYDAPTITQDLQTFSTAFGLAMPPNFTVVNQSGGSTLPGTDPAGPGNSWAVETSLDVEWAHAIAPGANILLVECNSNGFGDLMAGVDYARNRAGVVAVSMSFGSGEFSGETTYDSHFVTPTGHAGVTFLASTGDGGAPGSYPAYSPNVVAVGGTTLTVDSSGNYISESGWSGSGGGVSSYESQPTYQNGVVTQSTTRRATPDISFDADPASGVAVCDSWDFGTSGPWARVGGTSFSAPAWAGLIGIADQGRAIAGLSSLDGRSGTLPKLYALPAADYHDILTGSNGTNSSAGPGYDLVTGIGTPLANLVVSALVGAGSAVPGTPDLLAVSDTGMSNTDNITNLDNSSSGKSLQFAIGGTVAGATVVLYADGTAIGSATASGTTTTITTTGSFTLSSAVHQITATQTEPGKSASAASGALAITVDTVPPSVSGQNPSGTASAPVADVSLTFSQAVDPASVSLADVTNFTGPGGSLLGQLTGYAFSAGNTVLDIQFTPQSAAGLYQMTVGPQVLDVAGNAMSASYTGTFTLQAVVYSATMDSDPGWTLDPGSGNNAWQYGVPLGGGSHSLDPTSGHTGSSVIGYNLSGDYPNNMAATQWATTPPLDFTNYQNLTLSFWRWLGVQSSKSDHAYLQVWDGSTWTTLWSNPSTTVSENAWSLQTYTLPTSCNGQAGVLIRWGMGRTNNTTTYPGWNIDDVTITGSPIVTASIAGQAFRDVNGNGTLDAGEAGLNGVTVYLDTNNNGQLDSGEPTQVTSGAGAYTFGGLAAGTYMVREVTPAGYVATPPASYTLTVSASGAITGQNFGNFPTLYTGTAGNDSYVLARDAGGTRVQITETFAGGGTTTYSADSRLLSALSFAMGGGSDTLAVDYSHGNPVPSGGVSVDGGGGAVGLTQGGAALPGAFALNLTNGTFAFDSAMNLSLLSLAGSATATLASGGHAPLAVSGLSLASGAALDLADNALVLQASDPGAALNLLAGYLATGRNGGAWDGLGIRSAAAHGAYVAQGNSEYTGLALARNDQLASPLSSFAGFAVNASSVLIRYTYAGDATFDGQLTSDDYLATDTGYYFGGSGYLNGDFNYSGAVTGADYTILSTNYPRQGAPLAAGGAVFAAAVVTNATVVTSAAVTVNPVSTETGVKWPVVLVAPVLAAAQAASEPMHPAAPRFIVPGNWLPVWLGEAAVTAATLPGIELVGAQEPVGVSGRGAAAGQVAALVLS